MKTKEFPSRLTYGEETLMAGWLMLEGSFRSLDCAMQWIEMSAMAGNTKISLVIMGFLVIKVKAK